MRRLLASSHTRDLAFFPSRFLAPRPPLCASMAVGLTALLPHPTQPPPRLVLVRGARFCVVDAAAAAFSPPLPAAPAEAARGGAEDGPAGDDAVASR